MTMSEAATVAILAFGMTIALAIMLDLWTARWRAGGWDDVVTVINWPRWAPAMLPCILIGAIVMHLLAYHGI